MLTQQEIEKAGYRVLPRGGWVKLDPTIIPMDWYEICNHFNIDPECVEVMLCICGVKEIHEGDEK
jgi:hypothetical protein